MSVTESPMESMTTTMTTTTPFANFISSAAAGILSSGKSSDKILPIDHHEHNQITFEIPSHKDLEHIDAIHSFNSLLKRIGNVAYDTISSGAANTVSIHDHDMANGLPLALDAAGHPITKDQIAKSAVLNMAEIKNGALNGFERFFAGADIHSIINYLWIGVVTSLVILSVIFIVFSCYFWRKFREWKKCNKDIRSQLGNDMYPGGTLVPCDNLIISGQSPEAAFYQIESPPCYTIATGLPTYDEALHHHHQHYAFGMKFMYPSISAMHHQQYHEQQQHQQHHQQLPQHQTNTATAITISNWEKDDFILSYKDKKQQKIQQKEQTQQISKIMKIQSSAMTEAPPSYDIAASVALLSNHRDEQIDEEHQQLHQSSSTPTCPNPVATFNNTSIGLSAITSTLSPAPFSRLAANERLFDVVIA